MKNYNPGQLWLSAEIVKVTGPVSFHVRLTDGRLRRCHQDQLRSREGDEETMGELRCIKDWVQSKLTKIG